MSDKHDNVSGPPPGSAPGKQVVFHAEGLTKVYQMGEVQVHALRGVDLDLYDGELVVLRPDGRPDFAAALARENARSEPRIHKGARSHPITLVVFDLLYEGFVPLLDHPLQQRRVLAVLRGGRPLPDRTADST